MTNTPHTRGPWTHTPLQDTIWANDGDVKIATIADLPWINGKRDWMTEQANANLIASAPALLEALEQMVEQWEGMKRSKQALDNAKAAIQQAKG